MPRLVPMLVGAPAEGARRCMTDSPGSPMAAAVEVVLRNGRVLRVGAAADAAMVARLATALET